MADTDSVVSAEGVDDFNSAAGDARKQRGLCSLPNDMCLIAMEKKQNDEAVHWRVS